MNNSTQQHVSLLKASQMTSSITPRYTTRHINTPQMLVKSIQVTTE